MSVTDQTAVKWAWRSDTGWEDFPDKLNVTLENAWNANPRPARVKADKERFVDLSMTSAQIKKNFGATDCKDSELVGLQRRYDDENRRRAVKRSTPPNFFKGFNVFVALSDPDDAQRVLKTYSATISKTMNARTKVCVTATKDADDYEDEITKARESDIPVVTTEWITNSIAAEDAEDPNDDQYAWKKPEPKKKTPPKKAETPPKPKRKAEDSGDDDEQPPAKKLKTAPAAAPAVSLSVSGDSTAAAESSGLPCSIDVPSNWSGVCTYGKEDDFPFRMEIKTCKAKKITGTVTWPTLGGAVTKMRGTIEGNTLKFEEYEAVSGADQVQIPSNYSGVLSNKGKTLKGKVIPEDDAMADDATFELQLVDQDESMDEDEPTVFKEGQKLTGKCTWEWPFSLKIAKRKGDSLQGTIKWDLQGTETKFKGTVSGDSIKFEEYEMLPDAKPLISLPVLYNGNFTQTDGVTGKCGADLSHMNGAFKLTFDS